jgi:hypothetical protein
MMRANITAPIRHGCGGRRPGHRSGKSEEAGALDQVGRGGHQHVAALLDQSGGERHDWRKHSLHGRDRAENTHHDLLPPQL